MLMPQQRMSENWMKRMLKILQNKRLIILFTLISGLGLAVLIRGISLSQKAQFENELDLKVSEISREVGMDYVHTFNVGLARQEWQVEMQGVYEWITSQGSSVSVVDINNDGWPDVFFPSSTHGVPNHLYLNQKNGKFIERAASFGLDFIPGALFITRAIFFDANNDGHQDVFLMTEGCPKFLLREKSGKFKDIPLLLDVNECNFSISVNVLDLNNDSFLDVVVSGITGFGFIRPGNVPENFVDANNGSVTTVLVNQNGEFFTTERKLLERQSYLRFTNAIGVGDFFGKNFFDLWFATDFSNDEVYQNVNSEFGTPIKLKGSLAKSGMSVESTYLDRSTPYVFISHVYNSYYYPYGNNFWQFDGKEFVDKVDDFGLADCGWAWGAKFGDFNNDGKFDLYVSNGFFTGTSDGDDDYWYYLLTISSSYQNFLREAKFWPKMKGRDLSGRERDCFYLNDGNKFFHNVSSHPRIRTDEEKKNGRGVALIDYMNTGSLGILVSNQKDRPYFFQMHQLNQNSWIGLKFEGTHSNRDGIGVKAKIHLSSGKTLLQQLNPYNGYAAQSDARLHYGLGSEKGPVKLEVFWPSGKKQVVEFLSVNQYHLIKEEP
jgi:hypothetical protein